VTGFQLQRLGQMMEPEPGNPLEVEGVTNPAVARGPDGQLYLFPRLVAGGNYSRIGMARALFNGAGGGGGCEDPRITFVEPLGSYVMTYTALSAAGPRIALAISEDLFSWQRLGLANFWSDDGIDFDDLDDKDASVFPVAVPNPSGQLELAILHRPLFSGTRPEETAGEPEPRGVDLDRESIWISYTPMALESDGGLYRLGQFTSHHRLAAPVAPWERLKIGGGTPPVLTRHGWLVIYHGVSKLEGPADGGRQLCYSAGVMVLSRAHPRVVLYRSAEPVLVPVLPEERSGTIANVVFPTGIDRRDDLGRPDCFDVYYGMADDRIGVARLEVPDVLPPGGAPGSLELTTTGRGSP
jgi:predicted GH43/DUF377 family glycosyl hydrolase